MQELTWLNKLLCWVEGKENAQSVYIWVCLACFFFLPQIFHGICSFSRLTWNSLIRLKFSISHMLSKYVHIVFAFATGLIKASCECLSPCKVVSRATVKFACKWKGLDFPRGRIKNIWDKQQQLKLSGVESGRMPAKCSVPKKVFSLYLNSLRRPPCLKNFRHKLGNLSLFWYNLHKQTPFLLLSSGIKVL